MIVRGVQKKAKFKSNKHIARLQPDSSTGVQPDTLNSYVQRYIAKARDSTVADSVKRRMRADVRTVLTHHAQKYPGFQAILEQYQVSGDTVSWRKIASQVPGMDTLTALFNGKSSEFLATAEKVAEQKLGHELETEMSQVAGLREIANLRSYKIEGYNKTSLQKLAIRDSKNQVQDFFSDHPEQLKKAQQKLSNALSKYKEFTSSGDSITGIRRTSMQGKSIWEHLLLGGNFSIVSTDPVSIDFSPQLGCKFTSKFALGVGMNYRYTFSDSIKYRCYISATNTSFKAFTQYDIIKGFYGYAEREKSGIKATSSDKSRTLWKDNYFVGLGKKFLVHPKLYVTTTALYNLDNEPNNPVHPRRFEVRVGFQASELATRKRKVYYDPNR